MTGRRLGYASFDRDSFPLLTRRSLLGAGAAGVAAGFIPGVAPAFALAPPTPETVAFKIFWKGSHIGRHSQTIVPTGEAGSFTVSTNVEMKVKLAFVTAYRYEHEGFEQWEGGLLKAVSTKTHDDGVDVVMNGSSTAEGFESEGPLGRFLAPHTVMTSNTLWSTQILKQREVLDSQNGDIMGVATSFEGQEKVDVPRGVEEARRYRFVTATMAGKIWYDTTGDWVKGVFKKDGEAVEYLLDV